MAATRTIFISYRREDAADIAGRMRDWLVRSGGVPKEHIFMDVTTILPGADFQQVIDHAISQYKAMIVVISPSWVEQVNATGNPSIRLEIEAALRHRLLIVPVLVGGAHIPHAEQLPESLRPLVRYNARAIRADSFDYDMDWVRRGLGIGRGLRAVWIGLGAAIALVALTAGVLSQVPQGNPVYQVFHTAPAGATAAPTATATATATPTPSPTPDTTTAYTPAVPGPTCDSGTGHWVNPDPASATITCVAGGMQLDAPAEAANLGRVDFDWPGHTFPLNYTVGVTAVNLAPNTCVGIRTRNFNLHGYGFWVCSQGFWAIYKIDEAGNRQRVKSGQVADTSNDNFRLVVSAAGATQSFTIITADNVATTDSITDSSYSSTTYISLSAYGTGNSTGSATFTRFVYTPMP